jgi:ATP-binding protein involved in chromosome partitioning
MPEQSQLLDALRAVRHPMAATDVVAAGAIQSALVNGSVATVTLAIDPAHADLMEPVRKACEDAALSVPGITRARAIMTSTKKEGAGGERPKGRTPPPTPNKIKGVKKVIAVASGKGGVGKSTTAVNLAFALQQSGLKTALIDCDIYGPSAALLLGVNTRPQFTDDDRIRPIFRDGVAAMSMSFIVEPDTAAIWRGPMVIQAVQQFLGGVVWNEEGEIDVAIVDLPPGTGDVQLTLAQTANVDGAVIVSTPQDLALIDARKAIDMFGKTQTPILGIIENMSFFACPHCGERTDIFGHGGAREKAGELGIAFLGEIPLHTDIRQAADSGTPIVLSDPKGIHAATYKKIAADIVDMLNIAAS